MPALYNLRLFAPNHYAMAKFSNEFEVEAVYNLVAKGYSYTCDCPANNRTVVTKPCKHKRMMPLMLGAVNTDRFFDPERGQWHQPLAHMGLDEQAMKVNANLAALASEASGIEDNNPLNLPPYNGPPVDHSEAILAADLKLTGPSLRSTAPTIRRR